MKQFRKILVGVDLTVGDKLVADEISAPASAAIERALWLAKQNSAQLQFFSSLDIGCQAQRLIQENQHAETTVLDRAKGVLSKFVDQAKRQGVVASQTVTFGKGWLEIIRQVLREQFDLVIVGSRRHGVVERLFIGSTGMKLLRKCPCPVWVTHPARPESAGAILVGHDLTEVGDLALRLGASMAESQRSPLFVVHVIDTLNIDIDEPLSPMQAADESELETAQARIAEQLESFRLASPAEVQVVRGTPAPVLLDSIEQYDIDLLVMGTIARSGIEGILFGNTSERLLPQIRCSVLAIKPDDFCTPIKLD